METVSFRVMKKFTNTYALKLFSFSIRDIQITLNIDLSDLVH